MSENIPDGMTPEPDALVPDGDSVVGDAPVVDSAVNEVDTVDTEEGDEVASSKKKKLLIAGIIALVLLLVGLVGVFAWYGKTGKPLAKLPGITTENPPSYAKSFYKVQQPLGVAVDSANNRVYVTQSVNDSKVVVMDTDGNPVGELTPLDKKKVIHSPVYVAVNPTNNYVYVTDRATSTIYIYDDTGNYVSELKPAGVGKWAPLALDFGPDGTLYVTDVTQDGPNKAWIISPDGKTAKAIGENDKLSFPNGIALSSDGMLFISDSNNGRVLGFDPATGKSIGGLARGNADAPLGLPRGIAFDDDGVLYVVDTVNQVVRGYNPNAETKIPTYTFSFGEEGTQEGMFEYPNGIDTDPQGRVYVTDRENNRVQVWAF